MVVTNITHQGFFRVRLSGWNREGVLSVISHSIKYASLASNWVSDNSFFHLDIERCIAQQIRCSNIGQLCSAFFTDNNWHWAQDISILSPNIVSRLMLVSLLPCSAQPFSPVEIVHLLTPELNTILAISPGLIRSPGDIASIVLSWYLQLYADEFCHCCCYMWL